MLITTIFFLWKNVFLKVTHVHVKKKKNKQTVLERVRSQSVSAVLPLAVSLPPWPSHLSPKVPVFPHIHPEITYLSWHANIIPFLKTQTADTLFCILAFWHTPIQDLPDLPLSLHPRLPSSPSYGGVIISQLHQEHRGLFPSSAVHCCNIP